VTMPLTIWKSVDVNADVDVCRGGLHPVGNMYKRGQYVVMTGNIRVCPGRWCVVSVMSHLATLSHNSDVQRCCRSDTDEVTRCTLFGKRVAQLGDMPRRTCEFDVRVEVAR